MDTDPFEGIDGETTSLLPVYPSTGQNKIDDQNVGLVRWAINVNLIIVRFFSVIINCPYLLVGHAVECCVVDIEDSRGNSIELGVPACVCDR